MQKQWYFLQRLCCLCLLTLHITFGYAQTNTMFGVVDNTLIEIDPATGTPTTITPLIGVPAGALILNLTYCSAECIFYAIINHSSTPTLVSIDLSGNFTVIGTITVPGGTVFLMDALAYNPTDNQLYGSASLNGGVSMSDYYTETIIMLDTNTAAATVVATLSSGSTLQDDIDEMAFIGNVLYFYDGAPPGANQGALYELDFGTLGATAFPLTIYNYGFYIPIQDLTAIGDILYYTTTSLDLAEYDTTTGVITSVGTTHTAPTYNGNTIVGISYVENICPANNITLVPTMTQWGLFLFGLSMLTLGLVFVYNKKHQLSFSA